MKSKKVVAIRIAAATIAALGGYLSLKVAKYAFRQYQRAKLLEKYTETMLPSTEKLLGIQNDMIVQMKEGLGQVVASNGDKVMMLPTYVTHLPTGTEVGDCYAIDMGGTNFRVMYVHLGDEKGAVETMESSEVSIPQEVYTGTGQQLFDFMAENIKTFIDNHKGCSRTQAGELPLVGFCFSFPMEQTAVNEGKLIDWTKGFKCDGVKGNNPVVMLSEALARAGRPCNFAVLLNDTVAVLAASRYLDKDTAIGIIIGTGTNACYVEKVGNVTKWNAEGVPANTDTAINIEWGAFDSPSLPRCEEDYAVDRACPHPGRYMFEKLLSGMFLGEIARHILLTFASKTKLFGPTVPPVLLQTNSFSSATLQFIVEDESPLLLASQTLICDTLDLKRELCPHSVRVVVREICTLVAHRSARLVAIGIMAVLTHSGWLESPHRATVAFDGGVYEKFAVYRSMVAHAVSDLLGERSSELCPLINFTLTKDGSCLGAAVLAAAAGAYK